MSEAYGLCFHNAVKKMMQARGKRKFRTWKTKKTMMTRHSIHVMGMGGP